jgi:uncharacterized membrane protein YbhN (UPF0104 family)
VRAVVAGVVLALLAVAGRRYYDELWRLRDAPPGLVGAIAVLWLASRYPAADVMRVGLRALGYRIGRYEAFMLQMVQSYGNVLVPRAGIGMPALYLKFRHNVGFADIGAVQLLPMTLLQVFTIGLTGLACQAILWRRGQGDRPLALLLAAVTVACVLPMVVPLPAGKLGHGRIAAFLARLVGAWQKLGRSPGVLVRSVVTHALMFAVRAWRIQLCFLAVGARVPYWGAFAASLLADLALLIAVTPSALGFREAALVYAARVMGTTGDVAMAAAILDRLVSTACNIVVGQIGVWQFIRPALRQGAVRGEAPRDA